MSILDKASLIQIPSGYKNGKLYSVKPTPTYGSELVTNGDFSGGTTNWSSPDYNSTLSIVSGQMKIVSTISLGRVRQGITTVVGKKYLATATITNIDSSTGIQLKLSNGSNLDGAFFDSSFNTTTNAVTITHEFTATATTTYIGSSHGTSIGQSALLDNVSVKEATNIGDFTFSRSSSATRVNSEGLIEEMSANVPRLDYSDGSCASLLLEGQRTNIETKSTDINGWSLASNVTRTANYITSPDGTSNATRLQFTSNGFLGNTLQASGTEYTISCYAKRNDTNTQSFGFFTNGSGAVNSAISLTSDWKRFEFTYTATNGSYVGLAGSSGADVSVFGFQVEAGSFSTSLIYTSGATATRTADVCNNAGTSATFNSTEGVLFAEIAALANDSTYRQISLSDGTATNRISLFYQNTSNQIAVESAGSVTNLGIYNQNLTITNSNKIAVKYKVNDCALWINGVEVATDTSFAAFSSGTFTELSFDKGDGSLDFYGKCKQLMVFDEALSDSELTTLTS
jgi:hypothetical protein